MNMSRSLPWHTLAIRIVEYTNHHLQFNRRRSLLPVATIATGTLLVYVVLTLIAIVKMQMAQFSGTLSAATTASVGQATVYIAIIGLIVGALETAIVMTRSVLSRIHEIGVLKATGVSNIIIFSLFMTEAILYGVLGGFIGIVLGWIAAAFVQVASGTPLAVALVPAWLNLLIGLTLAVLTSIIAAFIPIWRTVRLSAIQAIYYQF